MLDFQLRYISQLVVSRSVRSFIKHASVATLHATEPDSRLFYLGGGCIAIAGDGGLRQWQVCNRVCHLAHVPDSFFAIRYLSIHSTLGASFIQYMNSLGLMWVVPARQLSFNHLLSTTSQASNQKTTSLITVCNCLPLLTQSCPSFLFLFSGTGCFQTTAFQASRSERHRDNSQISHC